MPALMSGAYGDDVLSAALPALTRPNAGLLESGTYYVAEAAGKIVGCGGWTLESPGSSDVTPGLAHLRHFATDPEFVRQGVGRMIFRECSRAAAHRGARTFQVFSSLNAEPFYRSLGLTRIERIELSLANGPAIPAILMEGPIRSA
jgi:GNAT superfamily N-acetyltransferase